MASPGREQSEINSSACVSHILFSLLQPKDPKSAGAALRRDRRQKDLCRAGAPCTVQKRVVS